MRAMATSVPLDGWGPVTRDACHSYISFVVGWDHRKVCPWLDMTVAVGYSRSRNSNVLWWLPLVVDVGEVLWWCGGLGPQVLGRRPPVLGCTFSSR